MNIKISLVICAYNEEKYIGACLESARKFSNALFEVIVVNNASTDKTSEVASSFPFTRVVYEPRKGLLWARQRGFEEAKGDYVAYVDSDCRLSSQWFDVISSELSKNQHIVGLSGPARYYDLPPLKNFLAQLSWWTTAPVTYRFVGYMIWGGNFVIKKTALEKIDGFNTDISFYGEDTDIARRLSAVGKIVFRMDFFVYTSGRRILNEGFYKTFIVYGLNFAWEVVFKKPFSKSHENHR